jgi:DNA polymerase-3 subunit delta'
VKRFASILGHERALEVLNSLLDRGRMPHAILFHGPEGVGKSSIARLLGRALMCQEHGCSSCENCRLYDAGNHPDFIHVQLELRKDKKELRKQIVVDQIRRLSSVIGLAPRMGARRLILIDPADKMNLEAQNALLKTLEEPPPHTVLILIAARAQVLVSTVRSRCFSLSFGPLRATTLADMLESRGFDASEAMARSALAEGRPGNALDLDLEAATARRETLMDGLERLASRRNIGLLQTLGTALAGKDEPALQSNLELLSGLLRDAARSASGDGSEALVHADLADRLSRLGQTLGVERAAGLVQSIDRLRDQLRFNLNRTLVAESVLAAVAGGPLPSLPSSALISRTTVSTWSVCGNRSLGTTRSRR